ncbi:MAG: ATP-dependent DNA helicase RecG [Wujia sp.]
MNAQDDIKVIKGIGEKTAQCFEKLGICTVDELIHTHPRSYLTYDEPVKIAQLKEGERLAVLARVSSYVNVKKVRNLQITSMSIADETATLSVTWFHQPYLKHVFHKGDTYIFVGTVKVKNDRKVMEQPEYYTPAVYETMMQSLQPVYPLTQGLSNKTFQKAIRASMDVLRAMKDYIPQDICDECGLMRLADAYETIHFPENMEQLKNAICRLAFDEFYKFLYDMDILKSKQQRMENTHVIVQGREVADFVSALPFSLTKGQQNAIEDILADMGGQTVMNRLIQGDVGSGKTVVAAAALLACAKQGFQGALMVPTEVLAKQHYDELSQQLGAHGIRVACLVGSASMKEKRKIYDEIAHGEIQILIGTHALIEDKVEFQNLALVVTDEQHRFGVNQRKRLIDKGISVHNLVMSATPIPRTLAIILYADLDISMITELPKGRKPIKNAVVGTNYREKAYRFLAEQIGQGNQVYVVCPMVEESENLDVANVTQYVDTMREALPPTARVAMLHGQMKADEKNKIMTSFLQGEIDVLVSTTVIEVGVNNPNATVMMVENAERFGLAQLHQLRGRVGRGKKQSYCMFINGKENTESMERLRVLENSNDGFYIAAQDLKLRGPGDFFGIRQSGEAMFQMADIYNHADMLRMAQEMLHRYAKEVIPPQRAVSVNKNDISPVL